MGDEEKSSEWKIPPLKKRWELPKQKEGFTQPKDDWAIPPVPLDSLGETDTFSENPAEFPISRDSQPRQRRRTFAVLSVLFLASTAIASWFYFYKSPNRIAEAPPAAPVESSPSPTPRESEPPTALPSPSIEPPRATVATQPIVPAVVQGGDTPSGENKEEAGVGQTQISEFVRRFVQTNQSQDVNDILSCYTEFVDYFDEGRRDHNYIGTDFQKYNERWPVRCDSIEGEIRLREEVPGLRYGANFNLEFYVESQQRREWIKGLFSLDLGIVVIDGIPKISSIKEQTLRREKGSFGSPFAGTWKGMVRSDVNDMGMKKNYNDTCVVEIASGDESITVVSAGVEARYSLVRKGRSVFWSGMVQTNDSVGTQYRCSGTLSLRTNGNSATFNQKFEKASGFFPAKISQAGVLHKVN